MKFILFSLMALIGILFSESALAQTDEQSDSPDRFLTRPVALPDSCPMPLYPMMIGDSIPAMGKVTVLAALDSTGAVTDVILVSENPPGYGFAESVQRTVAKWKFSPAIWGTRPVQYSQALSFLFQDDKVQLVESERSRRRPAPVTTEPKKQE